MFTDTTTASLMTADELLKLSLPDKCVELVRGQLVVREPPGTWHGAIAGNLAYFRSANGSMPVPNSAGSSTPADRGLASTAVTEVFPSLDRKMRWTVRTYSPVSPAPYARSLLRYGERYPHSRREHTASHPLARLNLPQGLNGQTVSESTPS